MGELNIVEPDHLLQNVVSDQVLHYLLTRITLKMRLVMRNPAFCICENKDADQLCGNREAEQRLCFRYTDSTIPLLPK